MSKTLVIAEKPSVAGDISRALGKFKKSEGFYENDEWVVTHAVGHLVELFMPNDFKKEWRSWNLDNLPMIPEQFKLKPIEKTQSQFDIVAKLIKRKDIDKLVNACDAGREGELIFRYIYTLTETTKPIQRLWLSSMTATAVKEGFKNLREGSEFEHLADAAICRSESDWLIGINGTRAFTCKIYGHAGRHMITVGRVQTPTLAIIVDRENLIKDFKKRAYWEVHGTFHCEAGQYAGKWFDPDFKKKEEDPEGRAERIWEEGKAKGIVDKTIGKLGIVSEEKKNTSQAAPLLYDLTTLQRECNSRFGLPARRTLQIAQALYERKKMITYPRTDSRALPEGHIATVKETLQSLKGSSYEFFAKKILKQNWVHPNKRIFNDAKVSDHFAIIPTSEGIKPLEDMEQKVFDMICKRFLAIFFPPAEFEVTTRITTVEAENFKTEGKILTEPGWMEVYGKELEEESNIVPPVKEGEKPKADPVEALALETKPPPRYSEATLLSAMEGAGKLLDDEELGEAMKERGLGTPATRAAIIEQLILQEYIRRDARELIPTSKGLSMIQMLHSIPIPELSSPQLTGQWEYKLHEMEDGKLSRRDFMKEIEKLTTKIVDDAKRYDDKSFESKIDIKNPCPKCGGKIHETFKWFACSKEGCDFQIWKSIASKSLTVEEIESLLQTRKIGPLDGFRSKAGRPFTAMLVIDRENKVSLAWDGAQDAEGNSQGIKFINDKVLGTCPICKSPIKETDMAYCCEKRAMAEPQCQFRIAKKIKSRDIPVEQMEKLLREGKTDLLDKFISAKKRPFNAMLTLDKAGKLGWEFAPRAPKAPKKGSAAAKAETSQPSSAPSENVEQLTNPAQVPVKAKAPARKKTASKKSSPKETPPEI
jgi:DNA topoisomerase-3